MFCATPSALDDYMDKKAVEGGNITRTVLCQLEDQIGADGAMFKPYTPEQIQSINTMLDRLMADTYTPEGALRPEMLLDTSWIERDVRRWCQQKGKEALQTGSSALDVFRKRSSVSAYRIMALCYYLYCLESDDKQQAQRRCRKIYNFFADYILRMLLSRWGKTFEDLQARRVDLTADTGRPKLIDRLPREFSRDQLCARSMLTSIQASRFIVAATATVASYAMLVVAPLIWSCSISTRTFWKPVSGWLMRTT